MKKAIVNVQFILDGIKDPVERGVLVGDKVLTAVDDSYYLHTFEIDSDGVYVVNLDKDNRNYLSENPKLMFDLVVAV